MTSVQKQENKEFSSKQVFVEHVIKVVKVLRVAEDRFRLRRETYEQIVLTVCALVRLRIGGLILAVKNECCCFCHFYQTVTSFCNTTIVNTTHLRSLHQFHTFLQKFVCC